MDDANEPLKPFCKHDTTYYEDAGKVTWCGACVEEERDELRLATTYQGQKIDALAAENAKLREIMEELAKAGKLLKAEALKSHRANSHQFTGRFGTPENPPPPAVELPNCTGCQVKQAVTAFDEALAKYEEDGGRK